jgi:hypothetical protein
MEVELQGSSTSAQDGHEWLASPSANFTPKQTTPAPTAWNVVGVTTGPDTAAKRKFLFSPGIKFWSFNSQPEHHNFGGRIYEIKAEIFTSTANLV